MPVILPIITQERLNRRILIYETDVSGPLCIPPHKFFIAWWPLILGVSCKHALDAHAYACDVLHRTPALGIQQVQADNAIGVDVWVDGDGALGAHHECYFGGLYRDKRILKDVIRNFSNRVRREAGSRGGGWGLGKGILPIG